MHSYKQESLLLMFPFLQFNSFSTIWQKKVLSGFIYLAFTEIWLPLKIQCRTFELLYREKERDREKKSWIGHASLRGPERKRMVFEKLIRSRRQMERLKNIKQKKKKRKENSLFRRCFQIAVRAVVEWIKTQLIKFVFFQQFFGNLPVKWIIMLVQ